MLFAGRGGNRSGEAMCLLHHLNPLLHRCFVLDCSIRRPWRQPLWWGRVLASPPEPSASPLLRPRLFVSQAVPPLWWGRVLASKPVPSVSPLLRLGTFSQAVEVLGMGVDLHYPVRMNFQTFARFIYERVLCLRCYLLQSLCCEACAAACLYVFVCVLMSMTVLP